MNKSNLCYVSIKAEFYFPTKFHHDDLRLPSHVLSTPALSEKGSRNLHAKLTVDANFDTHASTQHTQQTSTTVPSVPAKWRNLKQTMTPARRTQSTGITSHHGYHNRYLDAIFPRNSSSEHLNSFRGHEVLKQTPHLAV
jgi:hypothetical protein